VRRGAGVSLVQLIVVDRRRHAVEDRHGRADAARD
jgi:hypothetical protein